MKHLKYLTFSILITGFMTLGSAQASQVEEGDDDKPPATNTVVALEVEDDGKGKEEDTGVEAVVSAPQVATALDIKQLTTIAKGIASLIDEFQTVGPDKVRQWLLAQQTAETAAELTEPTANLLMAIVDLFPAKEGTKCYNCKQGCFKAGNTSKKVSAALLPKIKLLEEIIPEMQKVITLVNADGVVTAEEVFNTVMASNLPNLVKSVANAKEITKLLKELGANQNVEEK